MCRIIGYAGAKRVVDDIVSMPRGLREVALKTNEMAGAQQFCADGWAVSWISPYNHQFGKIGGTVPIYMDQNAQNAFGGIVSDSMQGVVRLASPSTAISMLSNPLYVVEDCSFCFNGEFKPWPDMRSAWLTTMGSDAANRIKDHTEPEHWVGIWKKLRARRRVVDRDIPAIAATFAEITSIMHTFEGATGALNLIMNRPVDSATKPPLVACRWAYKHDHNSLYYCIHPADVWVASEPVLPAVFDWVEFPKQKLGIFVPGERPKFRKLPDTV